MLGRFSCLSLHWRFGVFALDDVGDGGLQDVAFAILGDLIQKFCVLCLKITDLVQMVLLDGLQTLDLVLEQLFLLYYHLSDLSPAPVCRCPQDVRHGSECLCDLVMDALEYRCDSLVEVVEICDQLDETEVDKRVLASHNAAVYLLLPTRAR